MNATRFARRNRIPRRFLCVAIALAFAGICAMPARGQQAPAELVGRLSGDDVAVQGAVSFDVEGGRSTAVLASGSDVTVRTGQARIQLVEGGEIDICGPAHFTVLKSGGAITLALDYGRVHPQLDAAVVLSVYTPLIVATPIAIGQNARDMTVGLDQRGQLCAVAARGAVRIQQQLAADSLLVPQGGEADLAGSQLSPIQGASGGCVCELMVAKNTAPLQLELSVPVRPKATDSARPADSVPPPATEDPVYQVYMPPLTFDASSPAPPPEPSSDSILLVREARLRPEVVFRGHVESAPAAASAALPAAKPVAAAPPPKKPGALARLFGIFRRRKPPAPCEGAGCAGAGS